MPDKVSSSLTIKPKWRIFFKKEGERIYPHAYIKGIQEKIKRYSGGSLPRGFSNDRIPQWLKGEPGRRTSIELLCEVFDLDWQEVCIEGEVKNDAPPDSIFTDTGIDQLVIDVCRKISISPPRRMEPVQKQSIEQWARWIKEKFIELNFMEVSKLPAKSQSVNSHSHLTNGPIDAEDQEGPGRLALQPVGLSKTVSIKEAVENHQNLFVYGDPGSGKTNSLVWIAIKCKDQEVLPGYVPVFIDFGGRRISGNEDLLNVIETMFHSYGVSDIEFNMLLESGRLVFIFDAIDETLFEDQQRIEGLIDLFRLNYDKCRFIFSSRFGTDFSFSGNFQKVLIARLKSAQIKIFVQNWFAAANSPQAKNMLRQLNDGHHRDVFELAQRPILLSLLCEIFQVDDKLPTKRFDAFKQGIDVMARKESEISTDIPNLSPLRKTHVHNVLSEIARHFFLSNNCISVFRTREVERIIQSYFASRLNRFKNDIPAGDIIQAIAQYNGLLVQWAGNYCSFSHLTYQEYFVVQYLLDEEKENEVHNHIYNHRWRFVIGLISEDLSPKNAWNFFIGFKTKIDSVIIADPILTTFMERLQRSAQGTIQSLRLQRPYLLIEMRAWYFAYALKNSGRMTYSDIQSQPFCLPDFEYATSAIEENQPGLNAHRILYNLYHGFEQKVMTAQKVRNQVRKLRENVADEHTKTIDGWLDLIRNQMPDDKNDDRWAGRIQSRWKNRIAWFMDNLKLPSIADMQESQIEKLRAYYKATKLMSLCINRSKLEELGDAKVDQIKGAMLSIESSLS